MRRQGIPFINNRKTRQATPTPLPPIGLADLADFD
jgi:hypothetical protein